MLLLLHRKLAEYFSIAMDITILMYLVLALYICYTTAELLLLLIIAVVVDYF